MSRLSRHFSDSNQTIISQQASIPVLFRCRPSWCFRRSGYATSIKLDLLSLQAKWIFECIHSLVTAGARCWNCFRVLFHFSLLRSAYPYRIRPLYTRMQLRFPLPYHTLHSSNSVFSSASSLIVRVHARQSFLFYSQYLFL